MTHSSNICNHPPPVPLRNDLGLAVKIFWGRGQKKVISRNSVNCHQKPFTKSFPVLRIQLEAFTGEKADTQSHGPAGQTEETASHHKSVSHVPNGYREGWVFLPPQLSLGRQTQKQSLEINYLYRRLFSVAQSHKFNFSQSQCQSSGRPSWGSEGAQETCP